MTDIELLKVVKAEREGGLKRKGAVIFQVIFSGIGLMSDGYNAQVISSASAVLAKLYPSDLTTDLKARLSQAYFIGVIIGALLIGGLIDRIGRKVGVMLATMLLLLGVALSTASIGKTIQGMIWMLIVSRGILGVGAGAEYPVCAASTTEASNQTVSLRQWRGFIVAMTGDFAINIGMVMGGVLPLIVLAAFGYQHNSSPKDEAIALEKVWRIFLGLGGIIPLAIFYFRYRLATSTSFEKHNISRQGGLSPRLYWLIAKRYWKDLLGACLCWFLYDFVAYPANLLATPAINGLSGGQASLIQSIGYGSLINLFCLPGALLGAILLHKIGRKPAQMFGFLAQGVIGFILAGSLKQVQSIFPLFIVLYGLFIASAEAGPGVATMLISAEVAPTAIRGHFVGLAAATGKAGAAIGTLVFTALQNRYSNEIHGQQVVFYVAAGFSILGAIITYFMIPAMSTDLEIGDEAFEVWLSSLNLPPRTIDSRIIHTKSSITSEEESDAAINHKGRDCEKEI